MAPPWWRGDDETVECASQLLKGTTDASISLAFAMAAVIDGQLTAPLEKDLPALAAGSDVLIETAIRMLKLGHHLTQGTVDSNELWIELTAKCGDSIIGQSGSMNAGGEVDPWLHFVNVFMSIAKAIVSALLQRPRYLRAALQPSDTTRAGQTVHYSLHVPDWVDQPILIEAVS